MAIIHLVRHSSTRLGLTSFRSVSPALTRSYFPTPKWNEIKPPIQFAPTEIESWEMDNSGVKPLSVPGFGLPINWEVGGDIWSNEPRFKHGVNDFYADRMTVREVTMLRFMDAITDKPDWNVKVFNDEIVNKWREEAKAIPRGLMSEKAFEWCLLELRERAGDFERDGFIRTLEGGSRCVKSDGTISQELQVELKNAVQPLLQVDNKKKDWHPNSNNQVLNLVHPSLYPLIYGRTCALQTGQVGLLDCMDATGKGELTKSYQEVEIDASREFNWQRREAKQKMWSKKYQWLPCEVKFQGDSGTDVKITSYINNLHPVKHQRLYGIVEKFISNSIPLWNEVLIKDDSRNSRCLRRGPKPREHSQDQRIHGAPENPDYKPNSWEDELPKDWSPITLKDRRDEWYDWEIYSALEWKYRRIRKVIHPEPGVSYSYEQWKAGDTAAAIVPASTYGGISGPPRDSYTVKLEEQFRAQGLQVIVKLSSIELTPDNPSYPGGNWHLEGMKNEHIVATAIYYYDVENVTPSRLCMRQEASLDDTDLRYEQSDFNPLSEVFGTEDMSQEPAVQEIGSIATPGGRLLVIPNTLQHKVDPFTLLDATKPGHRRFLVLWLVDPHYRIMSTANVAPQQKEWWYEDAMKTGWDEKLPTELADQVLGYALEGQIEAEEARAMRLELMGERTAFADAVESNFETYNLCEH